MSQTLMQKMVDANPTISMKFLQNRNGQGYLLLENEYDFYNLKAPQGWMIDRMDGGLTNKNITAARNRRDLPIYAGPKLMAGKWIERSQLDRGEQYVPGRTRPIEPQRSVFGQPIEPPFGRNRDDRNRERSRDYRDFR